MPDLLTKALYDIAIANAFTELEYKRLKAVVNEAIDDFARTTIYDTTGVTPESEYQI